MRTANPLDVQRLGRNRFWINRFAEEKRQLRLKAAIRHLKLLGDKFWNHRTKRILRRKTDANRHN